MGLAIRGRAARCIFGAAISVVLTIPVSARSQASNSTPLIVEAKISLGEVRGRIDHLAIDLNNHRLFVAELGNNSVGVVSLDERAVAHRLFGLSEPQGVAFRPTTGTLYVANGGDGSVRIYRGTDYAPAGKINLGSDADNARIDAEASKLLIGYGSGALAAVDLASNQIIAKYPLKAHPESFQIGDIILDKPIS